MSILIVIALLVKGGFMRADITNMAPQDVALLIREWSEESQLKFASSVNKSYSSITKIETGERNLYLHTFLEWCRIKGIKVTMEKVPKKS